ncbi:MAG: UDP binding domain-containing protein, partial [Pseudomonadota bacterium]
IAFINEIADLCDAMAANVQRVARGIGHDNPNGPKFLNAGPGYGGSCFPKDTLALSRTATLNASPMTIVDAVIAANDKRKARMGDLIIEAAGGDVSGKTVALLGLTFKPNTDDMREAPSLSIVPTLQAAGASIRAFDPEGQVEAAKHFEGITFANGAYECLDGADLAVIITEWDQFRALDLGRISTLLREHTLIDLRNIYDRDDAAAAGLTYHSIGRPHQKAAAEEASNVHVIRRA